MLSNPIMITTGLGALMGVASAIHKKCDTKNTVIYGIAGAALAALTIAYNSLTAGLTLGLVLGSYYSIYPHPSMPNANAERVITYFVSYSLIFAVCCSKLHLILAEQSN